MQVLKKYLAKEQMQMNMPDIYDAALYLRLSRDDMEEGSTKTESNSIANQRELLRSFVKSQPDIQIFDIYVDDGYSGGNFDRPEFKRMTTDIEAGKVNCVIVKDDCVILELNSESPENTGLCDVSSVF